MSSYLIYSAMNSADTYRDKSNITIKNYVPMAGLYTQNQ